ncbi:hypothetical protein D9V86_04960 [Bacteroidetes/Chlorobi group bacterium ChocPot_Mid]|jgi:hypothetical protein|nr:MAG: hypothetical protein D9V86_04960 [Bacteroidetes/Chlorobi group bacterium ChocPot_Mid]
MKRLIAIFLLLFLILNTFGMIGYFYYSRAEIRSEMKVLMKSNIPKDKIIVLKIAHKSKYFTRIHKKEFRYQGKMYDIIKEFPQKKYTIYYCINDEKEEQLMESYSKLFETSDDGMTTVKYAGKVLKNIFFPLYIEKELKNNNFVNKKTTLYIFAEHCLFNFKDVELPPPKFLN